jgi:hypothetical protein
VVAALDAALVGMQTGGRRRVNVRPARGWKLPDSSCLKVYTDMAVVPGTQVAASAVMISAHLRWSFSLGGKLTVFASALFLSSTHEHAHGVPLSLFLNFLCLRPCARSCVPGPGERRVLR